MPQENTSIIHESISHKVGLVEEYSSKFITWAKDFLPQLLFAAITLILGLWLIKRISILTQKAMSKRDLDVSLRTFLRSLISIGLKIFLIVTVAGMVGFQTTSLVTILGAAGLAVGLALQGSLANFAGGVLILIFKPYRVGDTIEALGQKGDVLEIQVFNTILLTLEHKMVILPNGSVSNGTIINYSKHGDLRVEIDLTISETHSVEEVRSIIHSLLEGDERVIRTPIPPVIGCSAYVAGGYVLSIRFYAPTLDKPIVQGQLMEKIKIAFEKNNIEAPAPISLVKQV